MSGESGNPYTGIEMGRTLRLAREKRGLSLQQVEEATKIRARYLRDLENENFDVLPAVYVLGSLKTYAEHLGLDGAAMTGELKRRLAPLQTEQDQLQEDHPSGEPRGLLASLGRLVGLGGTVEDEAGIMAPDRRPGLYVSLAVVLVFIFATYLASSVRVEDQPSVSQVREPRTSQGPSEALLVPNAGASERKTQVAKGVTRPEKRAEASVKNNETMADSDGRVRDKPQAARASSSASALADAPTSAAASAPASASPASAAPTKTSPEPVVVRPEPVARTKPAGPGGGRKVAAAPTRRPAHAPGNLRIRKTTRVIPVSAPRQDNKGTTTVTKIVRPAR